MSASRLHSALLPQGLDGGRGLLCGHQVAAVLARLRAGGGDLLSHLLSTRHGHLRAKNVAHRPVRLPADDAFQPVRRLNRRVEKLVGVTARLLALEQVDTCEERGFARRQGSCWQDNLLLLVEIDLGGLGRHGELCSL